jgi:hypothetical protein
MRMARDGQCVGKGPESGYLFVVVVVVVVVVTLRQEAVQLLKSVVHFVLQSSLSHLLLQSLFTLSHLTVQSSASVPPHAPNSVAAITAITKHTELRFFI